MMVFSQIIGNDATVSFANSQGDFELNVFKPVIILNVMQSIDLLNDACISFRENALNGLKINRKKIDHFVSNSLMVVTALNPILGYDKSCKITQYAAKNRVSLKEACIKLGYLNAKKFDQLIANAKVY